MADRCLPPLNKPLRLPSCRAALIARFRRFSARRSRAADSFEMVRFDGPYLAIMVATRSRNPFSSLARGTRGYPVVDIEPVGRVNVWTRRLPLLSDTRNDFTRVEPPPRAVLVLACTRCLIAVLAGFVVKLCYCRIRGVIRFETHPLAFVPSRRA